MRCSFGSRAAKPSPCSSGSACSRPRPTTVGTRASSTAVRLGNSSRQNCRTRRLPPVAPITIRPGRKVEKAGRVVPARGQGVHAEVASRPGRPWASTPGTSSRSQNLQRRFRAPLRKCRTLHPRLRRRQITPNPKSALPRRARLAGSRIGRESAVVTSKTTGPLPPRALCKLPAPEPTEQPIGGPKQKTGLAGSVSRVGPPKGLI